MLFEIFWLYLCTGWTLLPKRNRFISFFIKIFIAIAESPIAGAMITWMYRISQAGYRCQFSWGILKWTFPIKTNTFLFDMYLFVTILTSLCNSKIPRSKWQYQIKRNLAKNYPNFLDHFDWHYFQSYDSFWLKSLIHL